MENVNYEKEYQDSMSMGDNTGVDYQKEYEKSMSLDFEVETKYDHKAIHDMITGVDANQEITDDDAERMIKLYYASNLNATQGDQRTPDEHDYSALVHSMHGENAPQMKKSDVFKTMQKMIVPEKDPEADKYISYRDMEFEKKWEEARPDDSYDRPAENVSAFGAKIGSDVDATEYSQEEQELIVAQYENKLRLKSPFLTKLMGKQILSPRMQKLAFDLANGVQRESMAFEFSSKMEQDLFPHYLRTLNPEIDVTGIGGTISAVWGRSLQTEADGRESRYMSLYRGDVFDDDLVLNLKLKERDILGGYDFANGKWYGDVAKEKAQEYMDKRWLMKRDESPSFHRHGTFYDDKVDVDSPEFHERMQRGNQDYNNKKWSRLIDKATRDVYDYGKGVSGVAKTAIGEGTAMLTYMIPVMAGGIAGGAGGSMFMSGSEFYGRHMDDLIYDHGVDISRAQLNALMTAIPYSMSEHMQVGKLKQLMKVGNVSKKNAEIAGDMFKKFPAFVKDKFIPLFKEMTPAYFYENSQEFAQGVIERAGRMFAKEYQEAEGITFDGEMESLIDEMKMSAQATLLPVIGARMMRGADMKGGAFGNEQEARNIAEKYADLNVMSQEEANDIKKQLTPDLKVAYNEAQTFEEKQEVLDDAGLSLKVEQVEQFDSRERIVEELADQATTDIKKQFDISEQEAQAIIEDDLDTFVQSRAKATKYAKILKHADIEQTGADTFTITGKEGGASTNLKLVESLDEKGHYDIASDTLVLPKNAENFTFTHEFTHAMVDKGLVTQDEFNQLLKYGNKLMKKQGIAGFADADAIAETYQEKFNKVAKEKGTKPVQVTDEIINNEIVAMAMEEGRMKGDAPVEVRNIAQRVWDWVSSMIGYTTQSQKQRQLVQDVFEGKPLQREPAKIGSKPNVNTAEIRSILEKAIDRDFVSDGLARSASEINREFDLSEEEASNELEIDGRFFDDLAQDLKELNDFVSTNPLTDEEVVQKVQEISNQSDIPVSVLHEVMEEANEELSNQEHLSNRIKDLEMKRDTTTAETSLRLNIIENLPKIDPKSLPSNLKKGVKGDVPIHWLSKNGVSIDQAVHEVWNELTGDMREKYSDSDVKNIVEEVIQLNKKDALNEVLGDPQEIKDLKKELKAIGGEARFSVAPQEDSQAFKDWAGGGEIIEHGEISDYKFTEGEPVVIKLYHGTTHADKLFEFKGEELGNKKGYFGAINYFTSSKHDADTNYLSEGADLTNRIQARAEEIASSLEYDPYIDGISEEEAELIEDGDPDVIQEISERLASEDLKGSQDKVLELYVRVDNPLVFGGQHENWIDAFDVEVSEEAKAEAREEIIDEYGIDEDEASDYEGEILGRALENEGVENKILEAVNEVIEEYDIEEYQADNLRSLDLEYGEFTGQQLMNLFRDDLADIQDMETGSLIGTHIFSQIVKKLGFDSIILNNADTEFGQRGRRAVMGGVAFAGGGMDMEHDTTHVHIFDKDNAKIKSATDNVGTYDPANPDIRFSIAPPTDSKAFSNWFGDSKVVNEDGSPKVVYHGTKKAFNKIDMKKGSQGVFWFGSDRESIERGEEGAQATDEIMELYAKIENPAGWREYDNLSIGELIGRGYDGVILPEKDGYFVGFVFEPNQIKSATENTGAYDPSNADIRFSLAPPTDSKAFKTWFGDSKVVNEDGSPKVVYHGSPDVRGIIDGGFSNEESRRYPNEYFFTDSMSTANTYARDDKGLPDYQNVEPHVLELYLSIENPMIVNAKGAFWRDTENKIVEAKELGHDGVIIKNSKDDYNNNNSRTVPSTVYVIFSPTQAKSAMTGDLRSRIDGINLGDVSNTGAYDPTNPDIRYSLSHGKDLMTGEKLDSLNNDFNKISSDLKKLNKKEESDEMMDLLLELEGEDGVEFNKEDVFHMRNRMKARGLLHKKRKSIIEDYFKGKEKPFVAKSGEGADARYLFVSKSMNKDYKWRVTRFDYHVDNKLSPSGHSEFKTYDDAVDQIIDDSPSSFLSYDESISIPHEIKADTDTRYALKPLANAEVLASTYIATKQAEGKPLTDAEIEEVMTTFEIEDKSKILQNVSKIVDDEDDLIKKATHTATMRKAIATKANKLAYQDRIRGIAKDAKKGGAIYQRAEDRMRKQLKAKKLAELAGNKLSDEKTAEITESLRQVIDNGEDTAPVLKQIETALKEELIKQGEFTKRKVQYKKDPAYRIALGNTLTAIANNLNRDLPPSRRKDSLKRDAMKLRNYTSVKFMESNFDKFLDKRKKAMIVEDKKALLKKWNKLMNSSAVKERDKSTQEIIRSKFVKDEDGNIVAKSLHPQDRRMIQLIKQVADLSLDSTDNLVGTLIDLINTGQMDSQKAQQALKDIDGRLSKAKAFNHLEPMDKAQLLLNAVRNFGALKHKSEIEIADSLDMIDEMIQTSFSKVEDTINKKNERVDPIRDALADTVGKRGGKARQKLSRFLSMAYDMRSWFDAIVSKAPEGKEAKAKGYLDEILRDWNHAIQSRDLAIDATHAEYEAFLTENYNKPAWQVMNDLEALNPEYSKFSANGDPMSKAQVMQLYASGVQLDYQDQMQARGGLGQYMEVLTAQDMKLIEWYRKYYADQRSDLSAKLEEMTGIPIDMQDPYYVPVKIKSPSGDLPTEITVTKIIPDGMIQRVKHKNDFDDTVSINQMWMKKVSENEHFKHTSDVAVTMRSVFSSGRVQDAIKYTFGDSFNSGFLNMVQDNINDGYAGDKKIEALDKLRGAWTASKFAINVRIGIKQTTSIPAFGFEIGLTNVAKHLSTAWTPEGRQAMREIFSSDLVKNRIGQGNTEAVMNSLNSPLVRTNKINLQQWTKRMMFANITGDLVPSMLIGQGIYRSYTEKYYGQGMDMAKAKETALKDLFQIIESTQQSSKLKDWSEFQRRYGSLGKMMSQFTNTTRQFLIRDFTDIGGYISKVIDTGDWKNDKLAKASSTFFINHVMLPSFYNGMNMLINMIMGDDIDEDDWWLMLASMVSGPFSGFIVFGTMLTGVSQTVITGKKPYGGSSLTPFAGITDDLQSLGLMATGILTADTEQFAKALDDLLQSLVAPYREGKKIKKNYVD